MSYKVKSNTPKGSVVHTKDIIPGGGRKVYLDAPTQEQLQYLFEKLNHPFVEKVK